MHDHVYKKVELVGSSHESVEAAIQNAITTASKSLDNLDWFEVSEVRGNINKGNIGHFQVVVKVGYRLPD